MSRARYIDISLPVDARLPVWPGDPAIDVARFLDLDKGDPVNVSRLSFSAHTGTHVDAPLHHFADGDDVEAMSLADLIGPAVVAEIRDVEAVDASLLEGLQLDPGVRRLLLKTDNSQIWSERRVGFQHRFVALTPEAAAWIVARGIRLVGVDYMSVEKFSTQVPLVHRTLLAARVVILEGLNLSAVSPGAYQLICLPLKLSRSEGAPARAILVADAPETTS